jgi:hypothetical protein
MRASRSRRSTGGQAMAIFALLATVLFVVVGLSIDAGTAFLGSDAAERAAAGGALSGVTYLPADPTTATVAARQEAARNGFADGDNANGRGVSVQVTQTGPHRLKVTVSQTVYTTFMHIIGFGSVRVSRSAEAEYLPPIRLGQPGYGIGTMLCVNGKDDQGGSNCLGNSGGNNAFYFMREEGWGTHRSEGDAFTPNPDPAVQNNSACGPGGSQPCAPSPADTHLLSPASGTEASISSLPDRGGYNYLVYVPAGRKLNVQVYNPLFAPDYDACQGHSGGCATPSYHEYDSSFSLGSSNASDYSSIAYTVFSVPNLFQHNQDVVQSQTVFYPIDASPVGHGNNYYYRFDTSNGTQTKVTAALPTTYHSWIDVANYSPANNVDANLVNLSKLLPSNAKYLDGGPVTGSGAYYRLQVSTLDYKGNPPSGTSGSYAHKGYAVRLIDTAATPAPCTSADSNCGSDSNGVACAPQTSGCTYPATLSSLDDMAFYTPVVDNTSRSTTFDIPIFQLDPSYAGKNIAINIFDPGDVSGTATMSVMIPPYTGTGGTVHSAKQIATLASGITDLGDQLNTPGGGTAITPLQPNLATVQTSNNSSAIYNGHWVHFVVKVPNDWQPPNGGNQTASDYWQFEYGIGSNSIADDTVSLQVGYDGTPVHLLP